MISLNKDNSMLGYGALKPYPNIFHFVTTRAGGFSKGHYASFNCSPYCGDDPETVKRNQQLLAVAMGSDDARLFLPKQTHSSNVVAIDDLFLTLDETEQLHLLNDVDAVITNLSNCCIGVSTADCVPVLLYDTKRNVVAAIHAGWRGTVQYIVRKTLLQMKQKYQTDAQNVIACIGPGISVEAFEVGDEVYSSFADHGFPMQEIAHHNPSTGKWHIDLWKANLWQLVTQGVLQQNIEVANICTWNNHQQFFSARRLGINSGRILSGIMIR